MWYNEDLIANSITYMISVTMMIAAVLLAMTFDGYPLDYSIKEAYHREVTLVGLALPESVDI